VYYSSFCGIDLLYSESIRIMLAFIEDTWYYRDLLTGKVHKH